MNVVIVVLVVSLSTYLILRAVRDTKPAPSPFCEQDARRRQLQREIDESLPISWRRGR